MSKETIAYSQVDTKEIIEQEPSKVPVVDFRASNVAVLYELPPKGLGLSGKKIAAVTGYSTNQPYNILRRAGVEIRPTLQNPDQEQRRVEGVRRAFLERGAEISAKIHTPEARKKVSETFTRLWAENHDQMASAQAESKRPYYERLRLEKEKKEKAKKRRIERQNIKRSRTILEHAAFPTLPQRQQELLRYRYRLDGRAPTSLKETGKYMDGINHERVRRLEAFALKELFDRETQPERVEIKAGEIKVNFSPLQTDVLNAIAASPTEIPVEKIAQIIETSIPRVYGSIAGLRNKLRDSNLTILSIYGKGYRLTKTP